MNIFQEFYIKLSSRFQNSYDLPSDFQKAFQWVERQREKFPEHLHPQFYALNALVVYNAIKASELKNLRHKDCRGWVWDKRKNIQVYQLLKDLKPCVSKIGLGDRETYIRLLQKILDIADSTVYSNPAQALYIYKLVNSDIKGLDTPFFDKTKWLPDVQGLFAIQPDDIRKLLSKNHEVEGSADKES